MVLFLQHSAVFSLWREKKAQFPGLIIIKHAAMDAICGKSFTVLVVALSEHDMSFLYAIPGE